MNLPESAFPGALLRIGRPSIAIFVSHVIITSGVRILLIRLGVTSTGMHLVFGTLSGVAVPLILFDDQWDGGSAAFRTVTYMEIPHPSACQHRKNLRPLTRSQSSAGRK